MQEVRIFCRDALRSYFDCLLAGPVDEGRPAQWQDLDLADEDDVDRLAVRNLKPGTSSRSTLGPLTTDEEIASELRGYPGEKTSIEVEAFQSLGTARG